MACVHLRKLYQLCHEEGLRMSGSDLIHVFCEKCHVKDVCPSTLMELDETDSDSEADHSDVAK